MYEIIIQRVGYFEQNQYQWFSFRFFQISDVTRTRSLSPITYYSISYIFCKIMFQRHHFDSCYCRFHAFVAMLSAGAVDRLL